MLRFAHIKMDVITHEWKVMCYYNILSLKSIVTYYIIITGIWDLNLLCSKIALQFSDLLKTCKQTFTIICLLNAQVKLVEYTFSGHKVKA